jgi:hypothetical protein
MDPAPSDGSQSGGFNFHDSVLDTGGGDVIGRDQYKTKIFNQDPVVLQVLARTFSEHLEANTELLIAAEVKAAKIAKDLNFTKTAVINFLKKLGHEEVPIADLPRKFAEIVSQVG